MRDGIASSESSLAIILGASEWPNLEGLPKSTTFRNSASAVAHYLVRSTGLGLPYSHVLDLFDDDGPNTGQLQAIEEFLRSHTSAVGDAKNLRNLLVYYVGHGAFVGPGREYILAIRSTRSSENAASSIRMSDLASILLTEARQLRRFLILDCCFAAAAFVEFQSSVSAAVSTQTLDSFPARGTSLLCAASRRSVALSDDRQGRTMFSGALIDVLTTGVRGLDEHLSLTEVGEATWQELRNTFHENAVRPEVHSPDRREGAVADVPLFPNPVELQRRAEAEAAAETQRGTVERDSSTKEARHTHDREKVVRDRLGEALDHPRFSWRSLSKLASIVALPEDEVASILRADPTVRFSRGKSKRIIVGLRSRVDRKGTPESWDMESAERLVLAGIKYREGGRFGEAIATFEEVDSRFGQSDDPDVRGEVAIALLNHGYALGELDGRAHDEIKKYDELIERFYGDSDRLIAEQVANAFLHKGIVLKEFLGDNLQGNEVFDRLVKDFETAKEAGIQKVVVEARLKRAEGQ